MADEDTLDARSQDMPAKSIYLMVFFSGFASLVYQILWMKQLGFLFGNTSHAAAHFTGKTRIAGRHFVK